MLVVLLLRSRWAKQCYKFDLNDIVVERTFLLQLIYEQNRKTYQHVEHRNRPVTALARTVLLYLLVVLTVVVSILTVLVALGLGPFATLSNFLLFASMAF